MRIFKNGPANMFEQVLTLVSRGLLLWMKGFIPYSGAVA
jgi:hypothetical protein